jgi:hypothetical protein
MTINASYSQIKYYPLLHDEQTAKTAPSSHVQAHVNLQLRKRAEVKTG